MNKNSKIFIAGHKGLVGSALMRKLASQGFSNIVTKTRDQLDLRNQNDVFKYFEKKLLFS